MNQHYFFSLSKQELLKLKEEYFNSSISSFVNKYNISNNTSIKLFGKKGMKVITGRKCKVKNKPRIKTIVNTENKLNCKFFNEGLHKKTEDDYYNKLFNN